MICRPIVFICFGCFYPVCDAFLSLSRKLCAQPLNSVNLVGTKRQLLYVTAVCSYWCCDPAIDLKLNEILDIWIYLFLSKPGTLIVIDF